MTKYEKEMEKWRKKFNVSEDDEKKRKSHKKVNADDEDEDHPKPEKTKGDRRKKVEDED